MPTMISRLSALALLVLAAAACATRVPSPLPPNQGIGGSPNLYSDVLEVWTKPDLDTRQFVADEYRCYAAATAISPTPDLVVGGLVDAMRIFISDARESHGYHACMARHGYRRV
jgi:hypothetical protein